MKNSICISFVCLTLIGCGGDLAGGKCPPSEACSPATPYGLDFLGAKVADLPIASELVFDVAVGGTQTFSFEKLDALGKTQPFTLPFTGASSDDQVLTVSSSTATSLLVQGNGAGQAYLRILDPQQRLYDRLQLRVVPIADVRLEPAGDTVNAQPSPGSWAVLAGYKSRLWLWLQAADHHLLVDEGAHLGADATAQPTRVSWDVLEVQPAAAGTFVATATPTGGDARSWSITVVDRLDAIAVAAASTQAIDAPLTLGRTAKFCFEGSRGNVAVRGLTPSFALAGDAIVDGPTALNCVVVRPVRVGAATLTVSLAGLSQTFQLTIGH